MGTAGEQVLRGFDQFRRTGLAIATLDEVLDHYAAGGRTIKDGPYTGVGRDNPLKSSFVPGFDMTPQERADMVAFLTSTTDQRFLTNPRFSDPWKQGR